MDTDTAHCSPNEAGTEASPQLAAVDVTAASGGDVTLELADLTIGQLSAVAALMLALDAAEARARSAERRLAAHASHCICRAVETADAEAHEVAVLRTAA